MKDAASKQIQLYIIIAAFIISLLSTGYTAVSMLANYRKTVDSDNIDLKTLHKTLGSFGIVIERIKTDIAVLQKDFEDYKYLESNIRNEQERQNDKIDKMWEQTIKNNIQLQQSSASIDVLQNRVNDLDRARFDSHSK